mmetsp:Transcript_12035/g.16283  ORF Transcript_12035/g.16283 Transcript_12035/m.16283 type:complete len:626 (-) Transcript_12035:135-2012(-)
MALVEVIENQRWAGRWSGVNLLPLDPNRYTGKNLPSSAKFPRDLPAPDSGIWVTDWEIDKYIDGADANGWIYAFDFPEFRMKETCGTKTSNSFVRRRVWRRIYTSAREDNESLSPKASPILRRISSLKDSQIEDLTLIHLDENKTTTPSNTKDFPILGIIHIKPLLLSVREKSDKVSAFDDDVYVRIRCRSPLSDGPGWKETTWHSSNIIYHASITGNAADFKLTTEQFRIAVTNPRSLIQVQLCRADDHKALYETSRSTFAIDNQMKEDLGFIHSFWSQSSSGETSFWTLEPCTDTKKEKKITILILMQAAFDFSLIDLVWNERKQLQMAPANPDTLSQDALKALAQRTKNIIDIIVAFSQAVRSCISWSKHPVRTSFLLLFLLVTEWHIDATKILAIIPGLFLILLIATAYNRFSGAWLRNWIQRPAPGTFIPCLHVFSPHGTSAQKIKSVEETKNDATKNESNESSTPPEKKKGLIADFYNARDQVLKYQSDTLRLISYIESFLNLLQWVHPMKSFLVFLFVLIATFATILLPLRFILISGTCLFFYDEYLKAVRYMSHSPPVIDARISNFIRSIPDAADLVTYFDRRTKMWLQESVVEAVESEQITELSTTEYVNNSKKEK